MIRDYKKLVKALRYCGKKYFTGDECKNCGLFGTGPLCSDKLKLDAAAAIEELLAFAHYVADKVTRSDEDWEDYHEAFAEVACRKLVKLGIVSVEGDKYVYSVEVQDADT